MPTKKPRVYILDTSAILSGKPISFDDAEVFTTQGVSEELRPGGRDYFLFQVLIEKGLVVNNPSKESSSKVNGESLKTGDKDRLSSADKEILALALDIKKDGKEPVIITDDYSIQNMAHVLNIEFMGISQDGIKKKFKWAYQCRGCGKKFKENIKICPICGDSTRNIIYKEKTIHKKRA